MMKYAIIMVACLTHLSLLCSQSATGSKIKKQTSFNNTLSKLVSAHDPSLSVQNVLPGCEELKSLKRPVQFDNQDHRAMTLGLQAMIKQAESEAVNEKSGSYQILCALYEAFKNKTTDELLAYGAAGSSDIRKLLLILENEVLSKLRADESHNQAYQMVLKKIEELQDAIKVFTRDAGAVKALEALSGVSNIKSLTDLNGNDSHKRMHEANSHLDPKSSHDVNAMLLFLLTLRHNRAMCVESPEFKALLVPHSLQQAAHELGIDTI